MATLLIVGAGMAGTTMALKLLAKKRPFTLINPTDSMHINFASVRAIAVKGWAEKSLAPLSPMFTDSFKKGKVVKINPSEDEGSVTLESGEELGYKYLVLATGTTHKWPVKLVGMEKEDAIKQYDALRERVTQAKSIVVAGGGATGCETVAELKHFFPDKDVTLVHASDKLVTDKLSDKSQQKLQSILTDEFKVKLVLGEKVANLNDLPITGPGTVMTDKQTSIQADVIFKFIGVKCNSEPYKDLSSAITERGTLKVDSSFRVEGCPNIYAIGDCTNIDEPKLAVLASKHGEVMAQSILNLDQGKPEAEYKSKGAPMTAVISLGPENGFGRTNGDWTLPVFMIKKN